MSECAEFIKSKFIVDGYDAQSLTINDPSSKGMLVQIRNATSKAGSIAKGLTGLGVCATLKLAAHGRDLELEVLGGKWLDKATVNVISWIVLWPLFITSSIGMWRQKKLLDRMFMETMSFFTRQSVQ